MEKNLKELLWQCLRFEFLGAELTERDKQQCSHENLKELYKLAKKHDIAHIVADVLDKNGLLREESIRQRYMAERNLAVYRYEQICYELSEISQLFEETQIPFIPLKGAVLRRLYPETWLRTSCDIDILVKKEDVNRAIEALSERLKYSCKAIGQHDAQLFSENGTHFELHFSLLESGSKEELIGILNQVWDNVIPQTGYRYVMEDSFLYCYLLSHMAKHVKFGGCGIRSVIDIWLLQTKGEFLTERHEELLKKSGLSAFSSAIEKLAAVWLLGQPHDGLSADLEEYILTGGIYGNTENKVAAGQAKKKNKVAYLLSRIFLPYSQLKYKYPRLQKHPYLFPFYQVKRWFKPIFSRESRKRTSRELRGTMGTNKENQEKITALLNNLEI